MHPDITLWTALLAGMISFLSPCVLPLVPAYLSFLAGVNLEELRGQSGPSVRLQTLLAAAGFVLGFSSVFILLGASATVLGRWLADYSAVLGRIAGAFLVLLGLQVAGIIRIPFLLSERRFHPRTRPLGWLGTYLVGVAFAFGWTPCIGPLLAGILALAGTRETLGQGMLLLAAYSAGLGLPFLAAAAAVKFFLAWTRKFKTLMRWVEIAAGLLLLAIGLVMLSGRMSGLSAWFSGLGGFAL